MTVGGIQNHRAQRLSGRASATHGETVSPDLWARLHAALGSSARSLLLSDGGNSQLQRHLKHHALDEATFALARKEPQFSARTVMSRGQKKVCTGLFLGIVLSLVLWPTVCGFAATAVVAAGYLANAFFRGWLFWVGADEEDAVAGEFQADDALPVYSVLIPLYREANILPQIAAAMRGLQYPRHLLDVKLVVEEDDISTVEAAYNATRDGFFEVVVVPPGEPRTKPRACNYALQFACGELLVIFDAEDRPEPDQLRKAAEAFRRLRTEVACLQARLNFFNARECWITRGMLAQRDNEIGEPPLTLAA